MKKLISLLLLVGLLCGDAFAGTIARPAKTFGGTSFSNGVVPDASDFNGDIDTIYSEFNGKLISARPLSESITGAGTFTLGSTAEWVLPEPPPFTLAGLPTAGTAGRLAQARDDVRGPDIDTGTPCCQAGGNVLNVLDAVTGGTGTLADPWTGWETAFSTVVTRRTYIFPPGYFRQTSSITINQDRVHLLGAGEQATIILFEKPGGGTAFAFTRGASMINQGSMIGFAIESSNTTDQKIMIDLNDVAGFEIAHIASRLTTWTGGTSIGLRINGRQTAHIHHLTLVADRPIHIRDNPNSTIDIDHFRFSDLELIAESTTANEIVLVDSGVNLTNVTFDGYQAWVRGGFGFKWIDTTSTASSLNLRFENVRWEQSTNATGYLIDIEHNANLHNLRLENIYGGLNTLGIKLRKVQSSVTIANTIIINTSGTALDVDNTVQPLILNNVFFQAGSTVSVGTLKKVFSSGVSSLGGTTDFFVIYALPDTITAARFDIPIMGSSVSIAQDKAAVIGVAANQQGFLFVITDEDVSAIYALKGGARGTAEVSDVDGFFTTVKDSAAAYNIYFESSLYKGQKTPSYKIQNKRTGAHTVRWLLLGDNI